MPIVTSHHVVPDPLGGATAASVKPVGGGGQTVLPAEETTTVTVQAGGVHVGYAPLILFLAVLVIVALAAIIFSARQPPPSRTVKIIRPAVEEHFSYKYTGARAALRRIFLRVRSRFEPVLGSRVYSSTVRELAAFDPSLSAFADEYSRAMYSSLEPGEAEVSRIALLAGEEV